MARPMMHAACHTRTILGQGIQQPLAGSGICKQILDDLADLHELIQAGRLGDKLGNSQILEERLVSPRPGGTPHAHWNPGQMAGAADLAQDVFARVLVKVQVYQDQVRNSRIRILSLPAAESEALASV